MEPGTQRRVIHMNAAASKVTATVYYYRVRKDGTDTPIIIFKQVCPTLQVCP